MFSPMNAAEILGPECQSSIDAVTRFLDAVGPHWFPIEGSNVVQVLEREAEGSHGSKACTSEWFVRMFFAAHNIVLHGEQRMGPVDPEFFRLGFVLEWLRPRRGEIRESLAVLDDHLRRVVTRFRRAYDGNRRGFEVLLPRRQFDPARPATFAYEGLVRSLVLEAKAYRLKKGDAADLCHAIMGSAYSHYAMLDKQWKRRVEGLRRPNGLARVYYQREMDQFVTDLEQAAQ